MLRRRRLQPDAKREASLQGVPSKRVAIVLRGPPGSGKTPIRELLKKELGKRGDVREVILDKHSGPPDNNRHRSYHEFDLVKEQYLLVELGYGGDATKCPNIWVDKLRTQGFLFQLYRLDASLGELKNRTADRPPGWQEQFTIEGWNRYKTDQDTLDFARRLSLPETEIDTTALAPGNVARLIVDRL